MNRPTVSDLAEVLNDLVVRGLGDLPAIGAEQPNYPLQKTVDGVAVYCDGESGEATHVFILFGGSSLFPIKGNRPLYICGRPSQTRGQGHSGDRCWPTAVK